MDDAPFLRQIDARPGDPLPRLIFADALDDDGDGAGAQAWRWRAAVAEWAAAHKPEPLEYAGRYGMTLWAWCEEQPTGVRMAWHLPTRLYRRLDGRKFTAARSPAEHSGDSVYRGFPDRLLAFAALTAAAERCIAAGKDPMCERRLIHLEFA